MTAQPAAFSLPDFTRVMWASSRARAVWEPRIARITAAWERIERLSVAAGVRPSALQSVSPEGLVDLVRVCAAGGLVVVVLDRVGAGTTYSASSSAVVAGQPWTYRVAVTAPTRAEAWTLAWAARDDDAIGELLGFPACCRAFFARTWGVGSVDPTGQMDSVLEGDAFGHAYVNILLRWIGVRLVAHMPCSFACVPSAGIAAEMVQVGLDHGFVDEIGWIQQMLGWPVEWSALHGIAEIKTPVLKIAARTDYTPGVQTIRRHGATYPAEGVSGNVFPYQRPAEVKPLTLHRSYRKAFEHDDGDVVPAGDRLRGGASDRIGPVGAAVPEVPEDSGQRDDRLSAAGRPAPTPVDPATWNDNGFSSLEAMDAAHAMILGLLATAPPIGAVLDLGCGNGHLMRRIADRFGVETAGLEQDVRRATRSGTYRVVHGLIADLARHFAADYVDGPFDVVLVSERRFDEGNGPTIEAWARTHARRILRYSYDEPRFALLEDPR